MSRLSFANRVAPARFIVFFLMLATSIGVATAFTPWWRSVMLGFDLSSIVFILSCVRLYNSAPSQMRKVAVTDSANGAILLFLAFALGIVILVAVGSEMATAKTTSALDVVITIATLLIAWFFGNTVYALHYSHLFYTADDGGKDQAGIKFPGPNSLPTFSKPNKCHKVGACMCAADARLLTIRNSRCRFLEIRSCTLCVCARS